MRKTLLIAVVALGVLLTTTGTVGASVSPAVQGQDCLNHDASNEDCSISLVSDEVIVEADSLDVGVLSHECFSEDGDEYSSCEHV